MGDELVALQIFGIQKEADRLEGVLKGTGKHRSTETDNDNA